ncbi:MAG: CotH kinase family protein, partial [Crocinitomicaceae bacterium]
DGDDGTTIPTSSISVFTRKEFTITDLSSIKKVILNMDYDDAFVAYVNGIEIARNGLTSAGQPTYNQLGEISHEANLYQNQYPNQFLFDIIDFPATLVQGINVICVEVHNQTSASSDLTCRPFLSVGVSTSDMTYFPTPTWFVAPVTFSNSTLPIVVLNTDGVEIPDEPKIHATMGIIYNGEGNVNSISDPFNEFYGEIGIETRGSSSSWFPMKSYGLETWGPDSSNYNVSIFDFPSDNDWILYAPYTDKSLIRNVLTYHIGNQMGNYSPRTKLCEVVLNDEYIGVYVFMERIKVNPGRVNINPVLPQDTLENELTGGYIVKIDKTTAGGIIAWTSPYTASSPSTIAIQYQLHDPEFWDLNSNQLSYIQNYITEWEDSLSSVNFSDPINGFRKFIDVQSFIDFMLVNELSKNVDGYRISTFLHKQRFSEGGKLVAGPLWDFNLGWGNADYCYGGDTTGWEIDFNNYCGGGMDNPFWWKRMLEDSAYADEVNCRWFTLRHGVLSNDYLLNYIDSLAAILEIPASRNYNKWPILGTYVWPNNFIGQTYQEEINYMKSWTIGRLNWMDNNMFGSCPNLGVNDEGKQDIVFYPNPSNSVVKIKGLDQSDVLRITDIFGRLITEQSVNKNVQIDVSGYESGLYIFELKQQKIKSKILIK